MGSKVLVISRNAWRNDNSTGNTMSNLFQDIQKDNIANIFCRNELPSNNICKRYFRLSDTEVLHSIIHRRDCGKIINQDTLRAINCDNTQIDKLYKNLWIKKSCLIKWCREFIWGLGAWKNIKLRKYIEDFNPDVIYMHIFDSFYMHNLLYYAKNICPKAKVILYTGDDYLTYKQFSVSPFYWINRAILRHYVKKTIKLSALTYCMTEQQIAEYNKICPHKYEILNKRINMIEYEPVNNNVCKIVYAGNLFPNRWKTLSYLARAINEYNHNCIKVELDIYSGSKITKKMINAIKGKGVNFKGSVNSKELKEIYVKSDFLLHVESFSLKDKLSVRLSLSTKIYDYLCFGKCIIAIGPKDIASMDFLYSRNLAYCIYDKKDLYNKLQELLKDKEKQNDIINNIKRFALKSNGKNSFIEL